MTMQACVRAPHYLSWNGHSHTFRMAVPRDLKDAVGKREIKKSLPGCTAKAAKALCRKLGILLSDLWHIRGPYVRFCERDEARSDHSRLTLLDHASMLLFPGGLSDLLGEPWNS
jgi:hypothetical protein